MAICRRLLDPRPSQRLRRSSRNCNRFVMPTGGRRPPTVGRIVATTDRRLHHDGHARRRALRACRRPTTNMDVAHPTSEGVQIAMVVGVLPPTVHTTTAQGTITTMMYPHRLRHLLAVEMVVAIGETDRETRWGVRSAPPPAHNRRRRSPRGDDRASSKLLSQSSR